MNALKKLFPNAPAKQNSDFFSFSVVCDRCKEIIEGRVNLNNDLSIDDENPEHFYVRKVLMGSGHCFQRIEVELKFDANRQLVEKTAAGGKFL